MARTIAILVARLIFGAVFVMAASFKFMGMATTATYIAAAGFPFSFLLAWLAAFFEVALEDLYDVTPVGSGPSGDPAGPGVDEAPPGG